MTDVFEARTLLRSRDLTHTDHLLGRLDAQHVAVVHGEHGVVDGLGMTVTSGDLTIEPGCGYSACGEPICIPCEIVVEPPPAIGLCPPRPGPHFDPHDTYTIWLTTDCRVLVRPAIEGRTSDALLLGTGIVCYDGTQTVWHRVAPERREVRRPDQPHVATGSIRLGPKNVQIDDTAAADPFEIVLSASIDTASGDFDATPLYFASIGQPVMTGGAAGTPGGDVYGWYTSIFGPTRTGFDLRLHVNAESTVQDTLQATGLPNFQVDVTWIGVEPNPTAAPIDRRPPFTPPTVTAFPVVPIFLAQGSNG